MGVDKSGSCFQCTYKNATIYVGCLNIIQALIVFTLALRDHQYIAAKDKADWLAIDVVLEVFLCTILIYAAFQGCFLMLIPWITYTAFKCVFGVIFGLIYAYNFLATTTNYSLPFETVHFLQNAVTTCALFVSWIIVVKYFHECRDQATTQQLPAAAPAPARNIYVLPTSKIDHKPEWV